MKHLRKISEELKSSVYKSAADKLKKMGHSKRVASLEDWSKIKANEEYEERRSKLISQIENIGTFTLDLDNGGYVGDFYINLSFDPEMFSDHYHDWISGDRDDMYIFFNIGILPIDKDFGETDVAEIRDRNQDGTYWIGEVSLHLGGFPSDYSDSVDTAYNLYQEDELSPDLPHPSNPKGVAYLEPWEYPFVFSDRRNAARFRKALIDIFKGDVIYKETDKNPGGLKGQVLDFLCSDRPILTIGEFEEFIKSLGRINLNRFFKD